jgi:formaldehyde-activating enzyme involved in methanogenesis
MVDPRIQIQDGSEFTIIPDEEENVYVVVAGTIVTINRPTTSKSYYKMFSARKQNGP